MCLVQYFVLFATVIVLGAGFENDCHEHSEFRCKDGSCISAQRFCDGRIDCLDHSDEADCKFRSCEKPEWFQCADNRTCLSHKFVCDGKENCPIGDDERSCGTVVEKHHGEHCTKYEYTCSDKTCIPLGLECDGKNDCPDNSDEVEGCRKLAENCPGYICRNKRCLTSALWVCDGHDDCGDRSDEIDCMNHCKLENNKFFCKSDMRCISLDKVCDNKTDCNDGSDEGKSCVTLSKGCSKMKCPGKCRVLPTGPVCICSDGYKFNEATKTCDDINECDIYGICTQGCINTKGSYRCTCEKRFTLKPDNKTCVVQEGEPLMFYTTQKTVVGVNLKSRHFYPVGQMLSQVIGVTYDGNYIYWTDINHSEESIERAKVDGSKREVLLTVGLEAPEDIAIDWYTGNIYFTDNQNKHLAVCSNHGHHCLILIKYELDQPRGIVLEPTHGVMFWSDWGKAAHIGRASMDGMNIEKFITDDIHWPNGLALDTPNERLYWIDAKLGKIQSIKLDGSDRRVILEKVPKHPYEIAIFEDKIFWSDWGTDSIHFCNKFTGKDHEILIKDRKIYDVHIYHPALMPKGTHPCLDNHCSHLCLLNDNQTHTCACPEGMTLKNDMNTCRDISKKQRLYLGIANYLVVIEHTTFGRHNIADGIPLSMYVSKMAYNAINDSIFIADNAQRIIYEVNLAKKSTVKLVTEGVDNVTALSFDMLSQNLYWADYNKQTIEVYSLHSKHRAIVHRYSGDATPIGMAVIPEAGKIFVALRVAHKTQIDIQLMHGRGAYHHFSDERIGSGEIQFLVDPLSHTVFWLDSDGNKIEFTDYDGAMRHLFRNDLDRPVSMALLEDDVVWTTQRSTNIFWTHRSNLASVKKFSLQKLPYLSPLDIIPIVASQPHYILDHPCLHENGQCSHVCVAIGRSLSACLCPVGMVFKDSNNKTCIESLDCEYRCRSGECITSSRHCNGYSDCADGSDEVDCNKQKAVTCSLAEFACHDGLQCITQLHRCDKHPDCNDQSDEDHCDKFDHSKLCHEKQYACENGHCIDPVLLCDGDNDCGDNSDEMEICTNEENWDNVCGSDLFRCTSGQCIPKGWVCDGHMDCKSGSDEHDKCPPKKCPKETFQCKLRTCIDMDLRCNGHDDCGDFSDELDCDITDPSHITCSDNDNYTAGVLPKFQCTSDPAKCLDPSARCNGTAECPRGEDEADCHGCRLDEFECLKSKLCISKKFRCDNETDCDDDSDEVNCENYNATMYHSFATFCHDDMFNCKDGTCIDWLRVCDGIQDCSLGEDELDTCRTACMHNQCEQKCTPSPYGAVCGCNAGYQLSANKKNCEDINECATANPCAQLCENTVGSYRCNCYPDFMLWLDKVRCKSIERGHYLLFSSFDQIRKLSENPSTLEIIYKTNDSIFTGLDVNVRRNVAYFTIKDTGSLFEYNLQNGTVRYIADIGNPKKLAVDWVANNVYYVDASARHSINVCHFSEKSACARLIHLKAKDIVKTIAIDAINKYIFYSVMHYVASKRSQTIIYRAELDGTRPKALLSKSVDVSAMECDTYKKILYFTDVHTRTLQSVSYEGINLHVLISHERAIAHPSGLSIYENSAFIVNTGSPEGVWCPLYGYKSCRALSLNVYNAEDVVVVAASRQKNVQNMCESNNCSLICVQGKLGPKCICEGGNYIRPGQQCPRSSSSDLGHRNAIEDDSVSELVRSSKKESSGLATIIILILLGLIMVGIFAYIFYRKRTGRGNFKININFHNRLPRPSGIAPTKFCRPAMSFSKGKTEVALDSRKESYKSAGRMAKEDSDCESMRDLENFDENPRARLVL